MKYRNLGILCKNFHFLYESDVIIYKVDRGLNYNERKCYNFDTCFVTNIQKSFLVSTKIE